MRINSIIRQLVQQGQRAGPEQLGRIIEHSAAAPFAGELLEVDELLWGSFWHFDVIAPGYRLPAVELALLRAIRLDRYWPEGTTVAQFLADLRVAAAHPQAGVWTLALAGEPCVVVAGPGVEGRGWRIEDGGWTRSVENRKWKREAEQPQQVGVELLDGQDLAEASTPVAVAPLTTIVWYCATTGHLHAGYRAVAWPSLPGAVEQRSPGFGLDSPPGERPDWLAAWAEQSAASELETLAARLDAEILRLR
jgi:hypothetical protein